MLCNHVEDGFENCATKVLWTRVQGGIARALEQTTLAELAQFAEHGPAGPQKRAAPVRRRSATARTRRPATAGA